MPSRRSSVTPSSLIGVLLLVLIVVVTMVGIGIGFYLQRSGDLAYNTTVAPIEKLPAQSTNSPSLSTEIPPPPDLAQAPPAPEPPVLAVPKLDEPPPVPANLPAVEPSAGATAPAADAALQVAALPPPSATADEKGLSDRPAAAALVQPPADSTEKPGTSGGYWVEFGVFVGPGYAERLRYALSAVGVGSDIVSTQTPNGRHLMRVRSPVLADHASADALAQKAQHALDITPLIHHTRPVPEPVVALKGDGPYWVQYGAFNHSKPAVMLKTVLKQKGVTATVIRTQGKSGKSLFLVRSRGIDSYLTAKAMAQRADHSGKLGALIGRNPVQRSIELRHKHALAHPGLAADRGLDNVRLFI